MLVQMRGNKIILLTLQGPEETDVSNIDTVLQKFWEIDNSAVMCENKRILEHTQSTIQLVNGQY